MPQSNIVRFLTYVGVLLGIGCSDSTTESTQPTMPGPLVRNYSPTTEFLTTPPQLVEVARFFAPVIYQYFHQDESRGDLLSRITYDGDWTTLNNWENLYSFPQYAYVYTSIIEDQNRYFVHYGTYHPRDYCHSIDGSGHNFPECFSWGVGLPGSNHENDMEGVTITVDKRFVTATWQYGQIITAETIYHHVKHLYSNCQLEGGYPIYFTVNTSVPINPRPSGHDNGCISFQSLTVGATTPQPSKRFELAVDFAGHGVWMQPSSSLGGDPANQVYVTYVPTDNTAQYPTINFNYDGRPRPVSVTVTPTPTSYALQFLTDPELAGNPNSLWDWRSIAGGPLLVSEAVSPGGLSYYTHLRGDNGTSDNAATVPWGQTAYGVSLGDWHNHPSWAWRKHWLPSGPFASLYYDYCSAESCHYTYEYLYNPFWTAPPPPPPPLLLNLAGPTSVRSAATCLWTATPTSGVAPYTYTWYIDTSPIYNNSSFPEELIYQNSGSAFTVMVQVNDAAGAIGSKSKSVTISPSAPSCLY